MVDAPASKSSLPQSSSPASLLRGFLSREKQAREEQESDTSEGSAQTLPRRKRGNEEKVNIEKEDKLRLSSGEAVPQSSQPREGPEEEEEKKKKEEEEDDKGEDEGLKAAVIKNEREEKSLPASTRDAETGMTCVLNGEERGRERGGEREGGEEEEERGGGGGQGGSKKTGRPREGECGRKECGSSDRDGSNEEEVQKTQLTAKGSRRFAVEEESASTSKQLKEEDRCFPSGREREREEAKRREREVKEEEEGEGGGLAREREGLQGEEKDRNFWGDTEEEEEDSDNFGVDEDGIPSWFFGRAPEVWRGQTTRKKKLKKEKKKKRESSREAETKTGQEEEEEAEEEENFTDLQKDICYKLRSFF